MIEATMRLLQHLVFHPAADREAWNIMPSIIK
jgi:hypothetical protein